MRDLIFLSLENWDDIWRRNQFVCAELSRRFPSRRILFVGKSLFLPHLARGACSGKGRRAVRRALSGRFGKVPQFPNISFFNPVKCFPNPLPGGRNFNEKTVAMQVRHAARRAGVRDPLLWVNPYDAGFLIGQLGERGVIYDITDDWELAAETPTERERIAWLDRDLCRRADLTMVCSSALFESRCEVAQRLLLVPNGVDAAHYAQIAPRGSGHFDLNGVLQTPPAQAISSPQIDAATGDAATGDAATGDAATGDAATGDAATDSSASDAPATDSSASAPAVAAESSLTPAQRRLAAHRMPLTWPRPVFGYTGTLHSERIDLDLVLQLARAHPTGSVVLIGPHHWTGDSLDQALQSQPNLFAPGPVPYARIPEAMAGFDVCIVPHRRTEFVESLNPIKLWEYLACGKPIVATDVAGFRDFPQLVRLAHDARGFIAACRAALQELQTDGASPLSTARRQEAAQHSWGSRVDFMLQKWNELGLISGAVENPQGALQGSPQQERPTPSPERPATQEQAQPL